jgi:hypothetical protein
LSSAYRKQDERNNLCIISKDGGAGVQNNKNNPDLFLAEKRLPFVSFRPLTGRKRGIPPQYSK